MRNETKSVQNVSISSFYKVGTDQIETTGYQDEVSQIYLDFQPDSIDLIESHFRYFFFHEKHYSQCLSFCVKNTLGGEPQNYG